MQKFYSTLFGMILANKNIKHSVTLCILVPLMIAFQTGAEKEMRSAEAFHKKHSGEAMTLRPLYIVVRFFNLIFSLLLYAEQ